MSKEAGVAGDMYSHDVFCCCAARAGLLVLGSGLSGMTSYGSCGQLSTWSPAFRQRCLITSLGRSRLDVARSSRAWRSRTLSMNLYRCGSIDVQVERQEHGSANTNRAHHQQNKRDARHHRRSIDISSTRHDEGKKALRTTVQRSSADIALYPTRRVETLWCG